MTNTEHLPSNWGRWGDNDEAGTLNLIGDDTKSRAAAEVRTGRSVSLALPIVPSALLSGPFVPATTDESPVQLMVVHPVRPAEHTCANVDMMLVTNHHPRSTHLDAVAHIAEDEMVYPGRPLSHSVTPGGVHHGSTVAFGEGIVTRGVLLDLAVDGPLAEGHGVTARDLEHAERRQGVTLHEGDALVVRCGWDFTPDPSKRSPGMSVEAVRWMHDRGVSLYVGDIGDAFPPLDPTVPFPMHAVGLTRLGLPLVDAANVEDLVAVCRELDRYSFMLVTAPPRIAHLTGVPVNPIAVF